MTDLSRVSGHSDHFSSWRMPSSVLSASERDFYRESYIRNLHKDGYPATPKLMEKFNKKFFEDHGLQGEKRHNVLGMLKSFNVGLKRTNNPGARICSGKPELKNMFSVVLADYRQKRGVNQEDDSEEDGSGREDDVDLEDLLTENDEKSDMEEEEEMAENEGAIAILENRNEELAKTLKMKDEECQQLEEKVRSLEEALQKKSKEQAQLLKKSDMAKLEGEKRSLEEEVHSLKEALQKKSEEQVELLKKSDTAKLEDEIRSLKAALQEKDQMLKTASKVQDVLTSFINKPAPQ